MGGVLVFSLMMDFPTTMIWISELVSEEEEKGRRKGW